VVGETQSTESFTVAGQTATRYTENIGNRCGVVSIVTLDAIPGSLLQANCGRTELWKNWTVINFTIAAVEVARLRSKEIQDNFKYCNARINCNLIIQIKYNEKKLN